MSLLFKKLAWFRNSILIYLLIGILTIQLCEAAFVYNMDSDSSIGFKENSLNKHKDCPANQTWYEESNGVLSCDCIPGYIYHLIDETCYRAHSRGPCSSLQIFVLPYNSFVPECQINVCRNDKLIRFRRGCYELDTQGPCNSNETIKYDLTELKAVCQLLPEFQEDFIALRRLVSEPSNPILSNEELCRIGTKKYITQQCPKINKTSF